MQIAKMNYFQQEFSHEYSTHHVYRLGLSIQLQGVSGHPLHPRLLRPCSREPEGSLPSPSLTPLQHILFTTQNLK